MNPILRILKFIKIKMRKDVLFERNVRFSLKTTLEGRNKIFKNADISNSQIGFGSYVGMNSELINTKLGKYSCIGPRVRVVSGKHPTNSFVSVHPAFFSTRKQAGFTYVKEQTFEEFKKLESGFAVEIGNDVWIGSDVIILEGIKIGDGAIIGSGCVVSKDVQPYSIYIGNPMQLVKYRFEEKHIKALLEVKWWDKGENWIMKNIKLFDNIDGFVKKW